MYLVSIHTYLPYKREFEYRVEASNHGLAIKRGYVLFRKEPTIKRKKVLEIVAKATKLL